MPSQKLRDRIIVVVTGVWVANLAAGILPRYEPDPMINGIFMGIVGGVMVAGSRNRTGGDPP